MPDEAKLWIAAAVAPVVGLPIGGGAEGGLQRSPQLQVDAQQRPVADRILKVSSLGISGPYVGLAMLLAVADEKAPGRATPLAPVP